MDRRGGDGVRKDAVAGDQDVRARVQQVQRRVREVRARGGQLESPRRRRARRESAANRPLHRALSGMDKDGRGVLSLALHNRPLT